MEISKPPIILNKQTLIAYGDLSSGSFKSLVKNAGNKIIISELEVSQTLVSVLPEDAYVLYDRCSIDFETVTEIAILPQEYEFYRCVLSDSYEVYKSGLVRTIEQIKFKKDKNKIGFGLGWGLDCYQKDGVLYFSSIPQSSDAQGVSVYEVACKFGYVDEFETLEDFIDVLKNTLGLPPHPRFLIYAGFETGKFLEEQQKTMTFEEFEEFSNMQAEEGLGLDDIMNSDMNLYAQADQMLKGLVQQDYYDVYDEDYDNEGMSHVDYQEQPDMLCPQPNKIHIERVINKDEEFSDKATDDNYEEIIDNDIEETEFED